MGLMMRYSLFVLLFYVCSSAWASHTVKHYSDLIWASPKGFDLTLDIVVPETQTQAKPVLVIFHGGGWLLNNKSIMRDLADAIATRTDVITVNANYRLLGDLNNTTTIDEQIDDAMGAVLWVKDHIRTYGGDPDKVAVTGDSAGGYLAAMVMLAGRNLSNDGFINKSLGFTPTYLPKGLTAEQVGSQDGLKLKAAILSYTGYTLVDAAKNGFETSSNPFWHWAHVKPRGFFGDNINVNDNPEYYQAVSPVHYMVSAEDYPLPQQLVLLGAEDTVIPSAEVEGYVVSMKKLGQPVDFILYPQKAHGFLDSGCNDYNHGCFKELSEPAVTDMVTFLDQVFDL
ncbi:alpha/beta hydrolase [Gynuella sp.]|uniref:alpha/beta hydrolase n=1 Tax=Gynuella sp. TaxID=2969146 RepID=UPI003D145DAA